MVLAYDPVEIWEPGLLSKERIHGTDVVVDKNNEFGKKLVGYWRFPDPKNYVTGLSSSGAEGGTFNSTGNTFKTVNYQGIMNLDTIDFYGDSSSYACIARGLSSRAITIDNRYCGISSAGEAQGIMPSGNSFTKVAIANYTDYEYYLIIYSINGSAGSIFVFDMKGKSRGNSERIFTSGTHGLATTLLSGGSPASRRAMDCKGIWVWDDMYFDSLEMASKFAADPTQFLIVA